MHKNQFWFAVGLVGFTALQLSCTNAQKQAETAANPSATEPSRDVASTDFVQAAGERMQQLLHLPQRPANEQLPNYCRASGRLMGLNEECPVFSNTCRVGDLACHQTAENLFFQTLAAQINLIQVRAHSSAAANSPITRAFHKKQHACVKALVYPVSTNGRQSGVNLHEGMFAQGEPREYKAWVRFSNASSMVNADGASGELRGMALKVLADGRGSRLSLNPNTPEEHHTQDFLATNKPRSTAQSAEAFVRTGMASVEGRRSTVDYFFNLSNPHVAEGVELLQRSSPILHPVVSVALETYWSGAPYRLGPHQAVKFNFSPCRMNGHLTNRHLAEIENPSFRDHFPERFRTPNYLRENLRDVLSPGSEAVCMELNYQVQTDPTLQPIENAFIEWSEQSAPSQVAARIIIPVQNFETAGKEAFCEALDFSPWHGTVDHQPIGETNRARRVAYAASQQLRHASGHYAPHEPTEADWTNWDQR